MLDIVVSFNTGFYKKGYLVLKRKQIVLNYLKTWFLIDLIASFPYSWFFQLAGQNDETSVDEDGIPVDDSSSNLLSRTP